MDDASSSTTSSDFADVGFMFDGAETAQTRIIDIPLIPKEHITQNETSSSSKTTSTYTGTPILRVVIGSIDDDPGALQSGHYLWPAAPAMANLLAHSVSISNNHDSTIDCNPSEKVEMDLAKFLSTSQPSSWNVIELGAGCGLAGITAVQVLAYLSYLRQTKEAHNDDATRITTTTHHRLGSCPNMVFTDHDPGTLERAKENYDATLNLLTDQHAQEENDKDTSLNKLPQTVILDINSTRVSYEPLHWGDIKSAQKLKQSILGISSTNTEQYQHQQQQQQQQQQKQQQESPKDGFDLVLGTDLIYSRDVVRPLLLTASNLLAKGTDPKSNNMTNHQPKDTPVTTQSMYTQISTQQSIFIMTQSFAYDDDTELKIDTTCQELGLTRITLRDDLETKLIDGVRVQVYYITNQPL